MVSLLRKESRRIVRELNMLGRTFRNTGLTHSEIHTMIEVDLHKVLTASELIDLLNLDKSTISRIVTTLQKKKLISITSAKHDARQKELRLTALGNTKLRAIDKIANQQVSAACELMDKEEIETVYKGLQLYAKSLWRRRHGENYNIRTIRQNDDAFIAKIIRQTMTEYGAVGTGFSIQDKEVDAMFDTYNNDRSSYFVIERNQQILGGGGIAPLEGAEPHICELKKMYFLPDLRGFGVGKKLLSLCLKRAKELGYTHCYLETLKRMHEANSLYQKFGFQLLDSPMGNTGHHKCDAWYLKEL